MAIRLKHPPFPNSSLEEYKKALFLLNTELNHVTHKSDDFLSFLNELRRANCHVELPLVGTDAKTWQEELIRLSW